VYFFEQMWYTIDVDRQVTGYPTGLHSETYRSLLWKHIPVSSIPFPYIFLERTGVSGVIPVLLRCKILGYLVLSYYFMVE